MIDLLRTQATAAAVFLLRSLPPGVRERFKAALGALGHEPGWAHRLRARNLAQTRKRLDVLVEAIVERLELAQFRSFAGAACLEFGSGHLLSEALIYHLAASPLAGESFDLISSLSVLEHVPPAVAPALLTNLLAMLRPGGTMVHNIHLEDHRDIDGAPFAFLAADTDWTEADYDSRGNRLRASDWVRIVAAIPGAAAARVEPLFKAGALLPADIDLAFRSYDPADLRTSRIILVVQSSVLNEPGRDRPPTTGFPDVTAAGDSSRTPAGM